ncbi:hypothetical protein AMTRI_Chr10g229350 [Amborella trichopoda]
MFIPPALQHNFKKGFQEAVLEGPSGNNWIEEVMGGPCVSLEDGRNLEDAFDVECSEKQSSVEKNMPTSPLAIHDTCTSTTSPVTEKHNKGTIQKAQPFPHFIMVMRRPLVSATFMVIIPQKFLVLKVLTKDQNITLQVPKEKNSWAATMT